MNHSNIVRLEEVFQTPTQVVFVMQMGERGSLQRALKVVKAHNYDIETFVAHILKQYTFALDYLHKEISIAHRDIKLENIVLSRDLKNAYLIDFELAEKTKTTPIRVVPCGIVGFASPENIRAVCQQKLKFDMEAFELEASDIFSLGVICYFLLSGNKPFKSNKFTEMNQELEKGLLCKGNTWKSISQEAKKLVEHMLKSRTTERATSSDILNSAFVQNKSHLFINSCNALLQEQIKTDQKEMEEWDFDLQVRDNFLASIKEIPNFK